MLKPLHDNVILKKEKVEKETTTASGIILTDNSKNVPSDIHVNDKVVYKEYSGTKVNLEEEEYIIIEDEDILAVLD